MNKYIVYRISYLVKKNSGAGILLADSVERVADRKEKIERNNIRNIISYLVSNTSLLLSKKRFGFLIPSPLGGKGLG